MQNREQDAKLKHRITIDAAKRAAVDPLPGSLLSAFTSDGIAVGDLMVRRIVAADWPILKKLDSPIIKLVLEMQKPEGSRDAIEESDAEIYATVWQFTHTPRDCRDLLAKGKDVFVNTASEEIGDTMSAEHVKLVMIAVAAQLKRSWETALKYAGQMKESGELPDFFDQSPESKFPATASDGGLNTSAAS